MSWILLSLLSAVFLGIYDLLKKASVRDNAVVPVLFFSTIAGPVVWLPFILWSHYSSATVPSALLRVDELTPGGHGLLFGKSALVSASWIFGYFAFKHLPLSIAGPIRATGPLWTIVFAVLFFAEKPTPMQWAGSVVILGSFYAFSLAGKLEGIRFHRDKWVGFLIVATLLGATSSLYDKFLLQRMQISVPTVQAWFSVYLVIVMAPFALMWKCGLWRRGHFEWRWTVPMVGVALLAADFLYFTAVRDSDALIAVISPIRRTCVIITFIGGIFWLGEKNPRPKALCVAGILLGVVLLHFG
ncbi:MAG: EamA family transporter [Verrucomicrobiae bacterium]|nr:EamA family transporter [Verrucomicrobiae bacterium]